MYSKMNKKKLQDIHLNVRKILISHVAKGEHLPLFLFVLLQAMFLENALLLLASSWLFTMVSWDTVGIPAAVFCGFLIGETHGSALENKTSAAC